MTIRPLLPALAIWFAAAVSSSRAQVAIDPRPMHPAESPQPKVNLRVDSNLVLVPVAVVDYLNHPVTGLEKENFRIFDDGAERTITAFAMDDEPVAVGLVYDHSNSVARIIGDESRATKMFLNTSNPEDEYFLVGFASKPQLDLPITHSSGEAQNRVAATRSGGTTALFDAVIMGLHELKKSTLNRKALLVVSDGGENNSRYSKRELQRAVEEGDALIYSIAFNTYDADFPILKWMAELSGGRAIPASGAEFPDIAAKIGLELRNRYVLGFPAGMGAHDGKNHSLRVQLIPPHGMPPLKASWRHSYRAPDDPGK